MTIFQEPLPDRERASLIERLMRRGTPDRDFVEDQLTEALAWLADHSLEFARGLALLFASGDPEAASAVASATDIGARTQIKLRDRLTRKKPDLSLCGTGPRTFQILIEVKVDAPFSSGEGPDGIVESQPEGYLRAWRALPTPGEAEIRRVGTLTRRRGVAQARDFASVRSIEAPERAADVSWQQVRTLLAECGFEADTALIGADLGTALDNRGLGQSSRAGIDPFVAWAVRSVQDALELLADRIGAWTGKPLAWHGRNGDYFGGVVSLPIPISGAARADASPAVRGRDMPWESGAWHSFGLFACARGSSRGAREAPNAFFLEYESYGESAEREADLAEAFMTAKRAKSSTTYRAWVTELEVREAGDRGAEVIALRFAQVVRSAGFQLPPWASEHDE